MLIMLQVDYTPKHAVLAASQINYNLSVAPSTVDGITRHMGQEY
jgi:hypothetical protein